MTLIPLNTLSFSRSGCSDCGCCRRRPANKTAKTDPIDAAVNGRFALTMEPAIAPWPIPGPRPSPTASPPPRRTGWAGRSSSCQILETFGAEAQRGKRAQALMKKGIQRLNKVLQKVPAEIDGKFDEAIRGSPSWRGNENLMLSVPGVGPAIVRTLIAELPELGRLDRRQVAALAGLAPFTRRSGLPDGQLGRGKAFIAAGRAAVGTPLFMGAMVAAKHNPVLEAFRERLIAAGKPKMVALIAVARKRMTILNAVIRDQELGQTA